MAYSSSGHAGFYKLEMILNDGVKFVTKLDLQVYE